jgi:ferredoxin
MRISIDRESCVGSAMCILESPGLFELDEQGLVVLQRTQVPEGMEEEARSAMYSCPAGVISVEE